LEGKKRGGRKEKTRDTGSKKQKTKPNPLRGSGVLREAVREGFKVENGKRFPGQRREGGKKEGGYRGRGADRENT